MEGFFREVLSHMVVEGGVVSAEQKFECIMKEYEFAMEQQKLKREDIRDLVELTVGRMDIYHLVGALLLEFCIHFYIENKLLGDDSLPSWNLSLFLYSNIGAVGYLLFAVWLSMHASVAAHSMGVRFLLHDARIKTPNPEQLKTITKLSSLFAQLRAAAKSSGNTGGDVASGAAQNKSAPARTSPDLEHQGAHVMPSEDDANLNNRDAFDLDAHKQLFQEKQKTWLCYDAYARACMALGINQLLQALSYFIVGPVAQANPTGAVLSLVAIQALALMLLRLDASTDESHHLIREFPHAGKALIFGAGPACLAGLYVWIERILIHEDNLKKYDIWLAPCFLLHAGWIFFLRRQMYPPDDNPDTGPQSLRSVCYLDVLSLEQRSIAAGGSGDLVHDLQQSMADIRTEIQVILQEEVRENNLSKTKRGSRQLQDKSDKLAKILILISEVEVVDIDPDEIVRASLLIRCYELWKQVPSVMARIRALRSVESTSICETSGEHSTTGKLNVMAERFENQTKDLERYMFSSVFHRTDDMERSPSIVSENAEVSYVEMQDTTGMWIQGRYWMNPRNVTEITVNEPIGDVTSFEEFNERYTKWAHEYFAIRSQAEEEETTRSRTTVESSPQFGRTGTSGRRRSIARGVLQALRNTPDSYAGQGVPLRAKPPQRLPWILIKKYSSLVCMMWLAGFLNNVINTFVQFSATTPEVSRRLMEPPQNLLVHQRYIHWPEPQALFEVRSLLCNASHIVVRGEYAMYVADISSTGEIGQLAKIGAVATGPVICVDLRCDEVFWNEETNGWRFQTNYSTANRNEHDLVGVHVPLPKTWHVVSATWAHCHLTDCRMLWVAGWDGIGKVVVGTLKRIYQGNEWHFEPHFSVHPGKGKHSTNASGLAGTYDNVRALQLGTEAETLAVLSGNGDLDAWDLHTGLRVGRWRVDGEPTSICHDEQQMFLARSDPAGPVLESTTLPRPLQIHDKSSYVSQLLEM